MGKDIEPLEAALATYVANAALKLRSQNSVCANIYVFAHTSKFAVEAKNYSNGITIKLQTPTNFTNELLKFALDGVRKIYKKGYSYQKCGVYLTDIRPAGQIQQSLFNISENKDREKFEKAARVLDKLNAAMGKDTVRFAAMDFEQKWKMRQEFLSGRYTTHISDILVIKVR